MSNRSRGWMPPAPSCRPTLITRTGTASSPSAIPRPCLLHCILELPREQWQPAPPCRIFRRSRGRQSRGRLDRRRVAGQRDDAGHRQRSRLFGNRVRRPSARKHARDPFPVGGVVEDPATGAARSEEHTSELQSLMRISYAVFCLKTKKHPYSLLLHHI